MEGREKERERNTNVSPTGDMARNPGMCPDWESNQQHFGFQASSQSTEHHQPGPHSFLVAELTRTQGFDFQFSAVSAKPHHLASPHCSEGDLGMRSSSLID